MTDIHDRIDQLAESDPGRVLFIMACSAKKIETDVPVALRDLYDGPTWRTLRAHGGFLDATQILVLSGKYGWTNAQAHSWPYNDRLTPQKAEALVLLGARKASSGTTSRTPAQLAHHPRGEAWQAVVICAGEEYRRVIDVVVPELQQIGMVDPAAPIVRTVGGIGYQRGQLGEILRALDPELRPALGPGM